MGYKIGSFNCLNFGMAASKDINKFIDIIVSEGFDIIALQEIRGNLALKRILSHLYGWDGRADTEVNDYAYIWNKSKFELVKTDYEYGTREHAPRIYKKYKIDRSSGQIALSREPFYARFQPISGPFIEIRIINTHIIFGDSSKKSYIKRKNEIDIILKSIYPRIADRRYGNNRPAYTVLIGDYNLNLQDSGANAPYLDESVKILDSYNVKKLFSVQKELTTLKRDSDGFANNYDHATYDKVRFDGITIEVEKINSVDKYCDGDYKKHQQDISDHTPIVLKMNLK